MRGRSSTGVEVSRRQTTRSSGGTDIFGSESLLACEVEYRKVVQREAQCWELVVKLFAEISSSTSAATFANRELPNWVDGEKERVAVKLNLQSSANLSPFDNRSSRCQLCLSTELYLHVLKVFFYRERSTFTAPGPCSPPESPEVASANHRRPWRCLWQEAFGGWKCPKVTGGGPGPRPTSSTISRLLDLLPSQVPTPSRLSNPDNAARACLARLTISQRSA